MTKNNLLFMVWFTAFIGTSGSLFFSEVLGYRPCELCWYQRILMYPIALTAVVAVLKKQYSFALYSLILSVFGLIISLYHYNLQKGWIFHSDGLLCSQSSCLGEYINWLGFITIPLLSFFGFLLISICSSIILKVR
jgi:disulfide bond formation protein DsbB